MPQKTARALGRGCAQRIALLVVAGTAVVLGFGGALVLGALIPLPAREEHLRPLVEWGLQVVAFVGLVFAALGISTAVVVRRAQDSDEAFATLGVPGNAFFSGRAYHGSWGGRRLDAYVFRGGTVEIHVESPIHVRAAVANRSAATAIARAILDKPLVRCEAPGFETLEVHADDAAWTTSLLADPVAAALIPKLVLDVHGPERRIMTLGPDAISLRMRWLPSADLTPTNVMHWVEGLAELARRAEDIDPPARIVEETPFERRWRTERGLVWAPVGWFALLTTAVLAMVTLVLAARILLRTLG